MDGTRFELVTPSMSTKCATTAPTVHCVVVPQGGDGVDQSYPLLQGFVNRASSFFDPRRLFWV